MHRTLIVFAKYAVMGRVKTRLARDVGAAEAVRLYRAMTRRLLFEVGCDPRWRTVVAVAPDRACARAGRGLMAWPRGLARVPQGPGDLGQRMGRALKAPPPGPVVIIGSDTPDIRTHHIAQAFSALGAADAVFGPAEDGGYWLIGLKRRPYPEGLFEGVRWSGPHALDDTLKSLPARHKVAVLETLMDIDTGADWARWRQRRDGTEA